MSRVPIGSRFLGPLVVAIMTLTAIPAARTLERFITLASTTSTEQSGLFAHILPRFQAKTGIAVRVVAVGTGQALKIGARGDADAVLVHDQPAEQAFVAAGFGVDRRDVMYNDFIIVGPTADPAGVATKNDAVAAFQSIAKSAAPFVSRGDDSGTYRLELRLWALAKLDPRPNRRGWYRETGSGMGSALNTAAAMNAYILTDRASWLSFRNRRELTILLQRDPQLFNQYGIMLVNPSRYTSVKAELGRAFIDWITSSEGQQAIADFRLVGDRLFFPNAKTH